MQLLGRKIPYDDNEEYHAWLSRHWDLVIPWERRLESEISSFHKIFQKYNVFRVLDIFSGTGEHDIALAREGYDVTGLNEYLLMHNAAMKKHTELPDYIKNRVIFKHGNYIDLLKNKKLDYDAAIFMGNSLAHNPDNYKKVLETVSNSLVEKNAVMIFQISNFEKILKSKEGLQDFNVRKSTVSEKAKYAFIEFYDPPKDKDGHLTLNMSILRNDGHRWNYAGLNSTKIAYITEDVIVSLLKQNKFKNIKTYGSRFLEPLFDSSFDPKTHDHLNVIAIR